MIRPAKMVDAKAIEKLIRSAHARSKYALRVGIADKALENLVLGLIAGSNQSGPQGTHVTVNVEDGKVVGFVAGSLTRIYNCGDRLGASDVFLVNEGRTAGSLALVDAYIEWARSNPKVCEIGLTWTDALPGAEKVAALYRRKGFALVGEIYEMRLDAEERRAA